MFDFSYHLAATKKSLTQKSAALLISRNDLRGGPSGNYSYNSMAITRGTVKMKKNHASTIPIR